MADQVGAIFDRGYRRFEGARLGRRGAMGAVVREGVRRVLGLRRKARRKVVPWALIVFGLLPAVALVGISFLVTRLPTDFELPGHGEYFDLTSFVTLLFMGLAAPELLVPDRTQGVLAVYFSRPLRPFEYLAAKAGALAAVMGTVYLLQQLLLYLGQAGLDKRGFFPYLIDNAEILWQVPLTTLGFFAMHAGVALTLAALASRVGVAAGIYLAVMIVSTGVATNLTQATRLPGSRYAALVALQEHPRILRDWIFGMDGGTYAMTGAGFGPFASLGAVVGIVALAVAVLWWRYRETSA